MSLVLQNLLLLFLCTYATTSALPSQRNLKGGIKACTADDEVDLSLRYGDLVCTIEDSGDLIYEGSFDLEVDNHGIIFQVSFVGYEVSKAYALNVGEEPADAETMNLIVWNDPNGEDKANVTALIVNFWPYSGVKMSFQVYGSLVNEEDAAIVPKLTYM